MRVSISSHLWHGLAVQTQNYSAHLLVAMLNIEVDLVGDLRPLLCLGALSKEHKDDGEDQQDADKQSLNARHGSYVISDNESVVVDVCCQARGQQGQIIDFSCKGPRLCLTAWRGGAMVSLALVSICPTTSLRPFQDFAGLYRC